MAELSSTNIYGHLTVSGDVRVSSIVGKADVISIPTTVLMEHADFGRQLIVKRNSANLAAAITYENSSGILGRAGFSGTGTYAIYYGTSTTAAWEIDANGVLQRGTIPWSRLSNVPSYATVQALDAHAKTRATLDELGHVNHVVLTTTLNTTWQGSQAPYTKTQTVNGILATDTPIVDVVMSGNFATDQARIKAWGYVYRITTANNSITLYATEKPTVSLPIQLKVVR